MGLVVKPKVEMSSQHNYKMYIRPEDKIMNGRMALKMKLLLSEWDR